MALAGVLGVGAEDIRVRDRPQPNLIRLMAGLVLIRPALSVA